MNLVRKRGYVDTCMYLSFSTTQYREFVSIRDSLACVEKVY